MTGSIKPSNLNQQLFWNASWLTRAWAKISNPASKRPAVESPFDPAFSVPAVFDDYAVEGEEPADLALLDLIPADLALLNLPLNLPCAVSAASPNSTALAVNASAQTDLTEDENELSCLIPTELSNLSQPAAA